MNLKHNSPATKVTDTTNIFWVAAALCWQSAGCNYIGPTQTRPAFYWLQLHWGKYDILTEFRVCCSSVRMKQLQFLLSNNRGPEVFARKKTPTINCHQNDNYHDHHWDETLRTVPVASESIRFYISTYSARFTLVHSADKLAEMWTKFHIIQAKLIMSAWCFTVQWNINYVLGWDSVTNTGPRNSSLKVHSWPSSFVTIIHEEMFLLCFGLWGGTVKSRISR